MDWRTNASGERYWTKAPDAKWTVDARGVSGPTDPNPNADDQATAARSHASHHSGLKRAGATDQEARLLEAIAAVESSGVDRLPISGDQGHSHGYFQFATPTAAGYGFSPEDLNSPDANYRLALKHLRATAHRHGGDMPTLGVIWNAGSVRPDSDKAWGVVYYGDTLGRYVRRFNALGAHYQAQSPEPTTPTLPTIPQVEPDTKSDLLAGAAMAIVGAVLTIGALAAASAKRRK